MNPSITFLGDGITPGGATVTFGVLLDSGGSRSARPVVDFSFPIYIPRNHLIERAISNAYEGDLMEFHKLCNIFTKPFKNQSLPETYLKRTDDDLNIKNTFCGT